MSGINLLIFAQKTKLAIAHPCSQQVRAMWDVEMFMQRSVVYTTR
jgi:hypothetical protein